MKKLKMMMACVLAVFALGACDDQDLGNRSETQTIATDGDYAAVLPFHASDARQKHTSVISDQGERFNIVTGLILSIGRVSGETAPILFTVAAYFLPKLPSSIFDQVMALPYHLYVLATSGTDIQAARPMAYGTALVLILIVLLINLLANGLRAWFGKKVKTN